MNKAILLSALLFWNVQNVFSQVDTSYVYNPDAPYGTLDIRIARSATRYYYIKEGETFSFRESAPGVRTNTFRDMTSWDSSPYTQGHLREKNGDIDNFIMNYRLLKPVGYNTSYAKGYPLIVMFHGSGEKANCWNDKCYHADKNYNPVTNNPPAPTTVDHELLNNDHNLLHGGKIYLDAVNRAGSKLPNDASLGTRDFPGFVLYPQMFNGWNSNASQDVIRIIRLLMKRYKIDPNRIYIHGISNGGYGAYEAIKRAPWMFAAATMMSSVNDAYITNVGMESKIAHIPFWIFQGALDENPFPTKTRRYITQFRNAGVVVRYTEYTNLGHTTWNRAYKESDFFSWMLGANNSYIHVFAGNPTICGTTSAGTPLQLPEGFKAYQWEKDGQIISGANAATYMAKSPGSYRARFSRISSTPAENQWNEWSPKVDITFTQPPVANILQSGTVLLKDLNNGENAVLKSDKEFAHYYWYKNGTLLDLAGDEDDTTRTLVLTPGTCSTTCSGNGTYTLVTSNYDNCTSAPSAAKYVFFNDQAPVNISDPSELKGESKSAGTASITWKDNANNENGFEIWRRKKTSGTQFSVWQMVTLTSANVTSFEDKTLDQSSVYQFKLRAVSNSGRSNYTPGGDQALEISTAADTQAPSVPTGINLARRGLDGVLISWRKASDNGRVGEYEVTYEGGALKTSDTTLLVRDLAINQVFNFSLAAVDAAGNKSQVSAPVAFNTYVNGLYYEHSAGSWASLDSIDFSIPEYTGFINNFTLSKKTQDDYFYFRFDGFVYITTAGAYQFRTSSDDGSRLSIDKQRIIDNNGIHKIKTVESTAQTLTAGAHRLTVDFFDYLSSDTLIVEYKGPDTNSQWQKISDQELKSTLVTSTDPTMEDKLIVSVFPNPSESNNINVQVESVVRQPVSVRLLDGIGRELYANEFDPDTLREGVKLESPTTLTNGIYILQFTQGDFIIQRKLIIKN